MGILSWIVMGLIAGAVLGALEDVENLVVPDDLAAAFGVLDTECDVFERLAGFVGHRALHDRELHLGGDGEDAARHVLAEMPAVVRTRGREPGDQGGALGLPDARDRRSTA